MILIISKSTDTTTELVASWLKKLKVPFYIVNENIYWNVLIDYENNIIQIGGNDLKKFKVIWFRKYPDTLQEIQKNSIYKKLYKSIINFSLEESKAFREYLFYELKKLNIPWLTKPFNLIQNKIIQARMAKERGILTPKSFIVNNKKDILKLIGDGKEYITKPFENCIHLRYKNNIIPMKTVVINSHYNILPETFRPALIQERINKKFELRIFYLLGRFYATRVMDDDNSEVDHRVSIIADNGRFEIYELPKDIKSKLSMLLDDLDLNCASIDMIVNNNDEFIFLEINPTGQFTYHSVFNNTYLEIEIAYALKKMNNQ
ncbi:hypothetical protein DRF60_09725 [Chryseobacterium elymi]|uniref:ATP-grasp domain-containing protein n=1 Tax=Chryseobacterium elymi TaxID=395936 RepID=A0A3D9DJD8_9FLAO|nr:hypothetical protein [Chryseobacterium elymi]REC78144.1 hypothetical protein DRF60_09725 [Chryseobacterium elymi]